MQTHRQRAGKKVEGRSKRRLISCFVLLNIGTVLFMNRPAVMVEAEDQFFQALDPGIAYGLRYSRWALQYYAFIVGLNNQWQMFGDLSRYSWWYTIKARYGDGEPRILPLPLQSERGFWERVLFDFKETKFHHTLYTRPEAREAYAHYLARQYPEYGGVPISSIIIDLSWQQILPRDEAARRGTHLDSTITTHMLQTVDFRGQ